MAFTRASDGTRIHYEVAGRRRGEPVLLVQGLGTDLRGWAFQRFALGRRHRLYLVDNRGVGGSDAPPGPYDLEVMAADARAVLDAEGVPSAHVVGASMGGVIAQLLAVQSPERVRSLVLACTACSHEQWRRDLLAGWAPWRPSGGWACCRARRCGGSSGPGTGAASACP
jgi:3-oxoadipate enol-lactonase